MQDIITGITDTDNISYCPRCGDEITVEYVDGTAKCYNCNFRFGVVEVDEE